MEKPYYLVIRYKIEDVERRKEIRGESVGRRVLRSYDWCDWFLRDYVSWFYCCSLNLTHNSNYVLHRGLRLLKSYVLYLRSLKNWELI